MGAVAATTGSSRRCPKGVVARTDAAAREHIGLRLANALRFATTIPHSRATCGSRSAYPNGGRDERRFPRSFGYPILPVLPVEWPFPAATLLSRYAARGSRSASSKRAGGAGSGDSWLTASGPPTRVTRALDTASVVCAESRSLRPESVGLVEIREHLVLRFDGATVRFLSGTVMLLRRVCERR